MAVTYGADYSARELAPDELNAFTQYNIRFLIRYIGYPDNKKCISHYPGAYTGHVSAGRVVLLIAEFDNNDPSGGSAGGKAMAERALADARSVGYPDSLPIFFAADDWLNKHSIPITTAMDYLRGAAGVIGADRVGAYGFRDFIGAAQAEGTARFRWLCGSAPTDTEVASDLCHFYQWNNGHITIGDMTCDLDWSYIDINTLETTVPPGTPALPVPPVTDSQSLPDVRYGERSPQVMSLQRFMVRVFPLYNRYTPTGFYGDVTAAGILEFQRRSGIPDADGKSLGPTTKAKLWAAGWRG